MVKNIVLFFVILLCIPERLPAQNYKFQALFIYNIVKRIDWPDQSNNFVIGVVDCKELKQELESLALKQKLGAKTIKVLSLDPDINYSGKIHAIFLGRKSSTKVDEISLQIQSKPVLLIGEKPGLKGVGINFLESSKGIEFEIYTQNINDHQLVVANTLLNLGVVKN